MKKKRKKVKQISESLWSELQRVADRDLYLLWKVLKLK